MNDLPTLYPTLHPCCVSISVHQSELNGSGSDAELAAALAWRESMGYAEAWAAMVAGAAEDAWATRSEAVVTNGTDEQHTVTWTLTLPSGKGGSFDVVSHVYVGPELTP